MAFQIALETEKCERLAFLLDGGLLADMLPSRVDESYVMLRFIDEYGHTTFNRAQMPVFRLEWERLYRHAKSEAHLEFLDKVQELARRCETEPHLYLKFYGD